MRRALVRQKVLKKCLAMRRHKVATSDPSPLYGQYGGQPLWAMSRDIDRTIAANHPKLRRLKRVEEVMQRSRDTGAILDEDAVSRRMAAFFQLKNSKHQEEERSSPDRPSDIFRASVRRSTGVYQPPPWAVNSFGASSRDFPASKPVPAPSKSPREISKPGRGKPGTEVVHKKSLGKRVLPGISPRKEKQKDEEEDDEEQKKKEKEEEEEKASDPIGVASRLSLDVDSKGRLRGIRRSSGDEDKDATSADREDEEELGKNVDDSGIHISPKISPRAGKTPRTDSPAAGARKSGESSSREEENLSERSSQNREMSKLPSKPVLPPIQPSRSPASRRTSSGMGEAC